MRFSEMHIIHCRGFSVEPHHCNGLENLLSVRPLQRETKVTKMGGQTQKKSVIITWSLMENKLLDHNRDFWLTFMIHVRII